MERIIIDGLAFSLPLFIMAIGGIYSEKSGVTNLALEGLQGVGAFTGALAAVLILSLIHIFYHRFKLQDRGGHHH